MQKMMLMLAVFLGVSFSASAQKKSPPAAVLAAFNQKFSNVEELKWKLEKNGEWEAEFEQEEVDMSANFSADGKWVETETEIKASKLPASVLAAVKGKRVREAARIDRADGTTVYEAEIRRNDFVYDSNGNLISQGKD